MKIRNIIILCVSLIFLVILPSIFFTLSNGLFEKNFVFANTINLYLEKIFPKSNELIFKKGDFFYKMGLFDIALDTYKKVECSGADQCQKLYHNIGNTYYKAGEILEEKKQVEYFKDSISSYQKSLGYKFDQETKKNYEFVLKKLQDLLEKLQKQEQEKDKKTQENKDEENKKNEEKKGSDEDKKQPENDSSDLTEKNDKNAQKDSPSKENKNSESQSKENAEQKNSQKGSDSKEGSKLEGEQTIPKGPSIQITPEELKSLEKSLTPEEKQEIQDYLQSLKDEEPQNREFNKPQQERDIFDILDEDFFGGGSSNKKDW